MRARGATLSEQPQYGGPWREASRKLGSLRGLGPFHLAAAPVHGSGRRCSPIPPWPQLLEGAGHGRGGTPASRLTLYKRAPAGPQTRRTAARVKLARHTGRDEPERRGAARGAQWHRRIFAPLADPSTSGLS